MRSQLWSGLSLSSMIGHVLGGGCSCITLRQWFMLENELIVTGINPPANLSTEYYSAQQGSLVPACVVTPRFTFDVIKITQFAERGGCSFAIKSGGRTPNASASNLAGGILIDMSLINEVTVSGDRSNVVVGTGNTWYDVYSQLDPLGLTTVGRNGDVGVGGFTLSCSLSPFSSLHGFGCDTVLSYEVVVNDMVRHASATYCSDLYYALRGGSNNFGVVTRITFAAYPQDDMWGGHINFEIAQFALLIDAMVSITAQSPLDPKAAMALTFRYSASDNHWIASTQLEYSDPVVNPSILRNFTSLPSTSSTMAITSVGNMTRNLAAIDVLGKQETFYTFTYKNDPTLPHTIWVQCENDVDTFMAAHNVSGFTLFCKFLPLTVPLLQHSSDHGGNSLGLTADTPLMVFLLQIIWDNAADQQVIFDFANQFIAKANATAHSMGIDHPLVYLGTAAADQNPFYGYGAANLAKLRAASQKYDHAQTFQKLVPGGFKL